MNDHRHLVDSKRKFVFLIMVLGSVTAIGSLTIDMYLPAFSAISKNLAAPENLVQLSLTTYFIGLALSQLLYGPIIDRYGKKFPLYFGLMLFIISSIACCFATNIYELIFFRFFQAMGACVGIVAPRAIVRDIFSAQESARVFSHLMLVMGLGPILAPLVGSVILGMFGWKAIFVFLTAFGIFCLAVTHFAIPQTTPPNKEEKISQALKKYWEILQDRNFLVASFTGSLVLSGLFAYITASAFAYIEYFHLSAKRFSLIFSLNAFGFIAASQINAYLLKKISLERILSKILYLPMIAGIALIIVGLKFPSFWPFTITLFFFIASIGAIVPNTTALALSKQTKRSGSSSALLGAIQFSFATAMSFLISNLHDGGISSMAIVTGICGIVACAFYKTFKR